jgi:hypothetical protein
MCRLVPACSETFRCSLFGWLLPVALVDGVNWFFTQSPSQIPRSRRYFHPDPLVMIYPVRQVLFCPS